MLLLRLGIFVDLKNSTETELAYACFSDDVPADLVEVFVVGVAVEVIDSSPSSLILMGFLLLVVDVRIGAWL